MRLPVLLVVAALAGCGSARLRDVDQDLSVSAESVRFGRAVLGSERTRRVELLNRGRGPLQVEPLVEGAAFRLRQAPPLLALAPGERVALELVFAPTEAALARGMLVLRTERSHRNLPLEGEGVEADACQPGGPCRLSRFDAEEGCVEAAAPDGTACDAPCLQGGTCEGGACVGAARSCDDQNPCTLDSCDAVLGCRHDPLGCAAPADPCQAPVCHPATGCGTVAVPDGTACGPTDCVTALACFGGQCQSRPAVDGLLCAPASPCHTEGRCAGGTCQRPAAGLVPSWTYRPALGRGLSVYGHGISSDAQGNLYLIERDRVGTDHRLVSFSPEGLERFRQPVSSVSGTAVHPAGGQVLSYGGGLHAHALSGLPLWAVDAADLAAGPYPGVHSVLALDNPARWVVAVETGAELHTGTVVALDATSGEVLWSRAWSGHLRPLASATGTQLAIAGAPCWGSLRPIEHVDAQSGGQLSTGAVSYLDAWTPDLVVAKDEARTWLLDAAGNELKEAGLQSGPPSTARITPTHVWHDSSASGGPLVEVLSRATWSWTAFALPGSSSARSLELTGAGSALVVQPATSLQDVPLLSELLPDGSVQFSCVLPEQSWIALPGLDRIFVAGEDLLAALPAPGVRPASKGFTGARGGPSRSGQPQ